MPFSQEQLDLLNAPLSRAVVKEREQARRRFSYVEGWFMIAEANRIFGFDKWACDTIETKCVVEKDRLIGKQALPGYGVTYTARVRIHVTVGDMQLFRDGVGAGHGIDQDLGQAHESALKEAETDAFKRAIRTFGNPFGLALYDKEQVNVADEPEEPDARAKYMDECKRKIATFPDNSTLALTWWNDPINHQARDDWLLPPDRLELQALVKAKLPPRDMNT